MVYCVWLFVGWVFCYVIVIGWVENNLVVDFVGVLEQLQIKYFVSVIDFVKIGDLFWVMYFYWGLLVIVVVLKLVLMFFVCLGEL